MGFTWQGVIPKQQQPMAEKIGRLAAEDIFSFDSIEQKISDPRNIEKIMPVIDQHVEDFLRVKLGKEMPMISMFIGDKTIATMKKIFMQELETLFPQVMKSYAANLKSEIRLEKMVTDKIAGFPMDKLETIFYQQLSKEIKIIKLTGAAAGFLIGIIQILLTLVIS
ncbi:MAG: DUF445 domain-containing protein [Bacteroidota bacterium]